MSWLDDDAFADARAHLSARAGEGRVALVVRNLWQDGASLAENDLRAQFAGTPLAGPTMPVIDLRPDGLVPLLADEETPVVGSTTGESSQLESLFGRLEAGAGFVLHLRGPARRSMAFAFEASSEIAPFVRATPLLQKLLMELASRYTLVIVGEDPAIVAQVIPFHDLGTGPHYAIVQDPPGEAARNVRGLPLDVPTRLSLLASLRWLRSAASALHTEKAPPPPRIERVRLSMIGPYDRLEFAPAESWSVLLGGNGHGKTSVLRATALGLLGDDPRAQASAASLLRVGASYGVIELRVGGRDFVTELFREGTSVRVVNKSGRSPLHALGVTMVGFPALRGAVPSMSTPFMSEASVRPDAGDLLPMLVGGADARIASVRQWIAQTRLRAELARSRDPSEAARLDALLERFFSMLVELIPGLSLRLGRIEPASGQVTVITDSGEVPLDALSQGTTAVLGWVGTVLLRLLETHPQSATPEREPAIVLVDEIDAHMQPEWQQALVGLVRERLPNLQVIATSHSPLVVGSLGDGRVFRVPPLSGSRDVTLAPMTERFEQYRADQILTSEAFGLDGTTSARGMKLREEFSRLNATSRRSSQEEARFQALSKELEATIPSSPETPAGREAMALVEEALEARGAKHPEKTLEAAKALLAELERLP